MSSSQDIEAPKVASPLSSDTVTEGIRIQADPSYVPDQSNPPKAEYLFAYHIRMTNEGKEIVRLVSRHWIIINANGGQHEVRGPGVVGKHPKLTPGESFEYSSFCPLDTEWGTMEGSFEMERENGDHFQVAIGRFFLTTTGPTSTSRE